MQEAGEQYGRQISIEEIEGFETRTQIPVPEFIREAKVITPAEAYEFAVAHLPVPDYPEEYRFLNSTAGLRAIRENGGSIEAAGERLALPRVSLADVALALENNAFDKEAIISQEARRRNQRDRQILVLEAALVRKYYGIEVQASTLADYAQWIAETVGDPGNHLAYYAHILGHYNPMTSGLSRSFNPTKEWMDYFEGGYDITSNWNLNSSNTDRLDFYSRFVIDAAFPDFHAVTREDGPGLLTHTTSLYSFDAIWKARRLGGTDAARVCFSDGRFTASPKNIYLGPDGQLLWEADEEVALVFDKETITRLYIALPMSRPPFFRQFCEAWQTY